uniref:Uncharacterized protein n=1 Tax=Arundo donax TaxID=35708 RepID=A0A0A9BJB4_ARUDO
MHQETSNKQVNENRRIRMVGCSCWRRSRRSEG